VPGLDARGATKPGAYRSAKASHGGSGGVPLVVIVLATLAALIHVWFFVMESVWFEQERVWRRFGLTSPEDAAIVRSFAFNQGFYNLFLAVGVGLGLALAATGDPHGGRLVVAFATGSMVAAGVVLFVHNPRFLQAAAIQVLPALAALLAILLIG
jgi:putative membrane protein